MTTELYVFFNTEIWMWKLDIGQSFKKSITAFNIGAIHECKVPAEGIRYKNK